MSPDQIADERRRGRLSAVAASLAAALFAVAAIWSQSLSNDAPQRNTPALLRFFDRHSSQLIGLLSFSGSIALAVWFIKGCLDAMRVGLLSRFMGVVGIAMGPGLVLASGLFQFLLPVWLAAVAAMFAGFSVRGRPPAWDAGEAVVPPSAREQLGEALEDTGLRTAPNGEVEAVGPGVRQTDGDAGAPARRKRKRRR